MVGAINNSMKKTRMHITAGASGSYPGPMGAPRTTDDFREKFNIQNILGNIISPKTRDKMEEEMKDEKKKSVFGNEELPIAAMIIGGMVIWLAVRWLRK
jgi:hypothetical protein